VKERELVRLVAEGNSAKKIASMLNVSTTTVKSRRRRIMQKLDTSNVAELTEIARERGWLAGDDSVTDTASSALSILRTKLHRPPLPPDHIPRSQLLDWLSTRCQVPLTLISAPAGYGKTTLASSWLEICEYPSAWLSLDEDDSDLRRFLAYLLAAIRTIFPAAGHAIQAFLSAPNLPPVSALAQYLINDLDEIEEPFILVLDDYHSIRERGVHDLLTEFLHHPPSTMHLALVTRRDPPLPLSILRSRGRMNEISSSQLRFSLAETVAFLENVLDSPVEEAAATDIDDKLEGWPVGLRLIAHSLDGHHDLERVISGLHGDFRSIVDYLVTEVLSRQPPRVVERLLKTAILNRFCAELCDALCGHSSDQGEGEIDGTRFLAWLHTNNLFVVSQDPEHRWLRYHQLFQQLLQNRLRDRLSCEEFSALHLRASSWFAENGYIDEAIEYALAADDDISAARIVEQNRRAALDDDRLITLQKWLERLPYEIRQKRPELLLGEAWVQLNAVQIENILPIVERVELLLREDTADAALLTEMEFFRGIISYFQGDSEHTREAFAQAKETLSNDSFVTLKAEIEYWSFLVLHLDGRKGTAVRGLEEAIRRTDKDDRMMMSRLIFGLCLIHMLEAEFVQALEKVLHLGEVSTSNVLDYVDMWASYLQGNASLQMFDLDAARHHFSEVVDNRYIASARVAVDAMAGLAITRQLLGEPDAAEETMSVAQEYAQWSKDPAYGEYVRSCRARLALLRGDLDAAFRFGGSSGTGFGNSATLFFIECPDITVCRLLIAEGSETSLKEAKNGLDGLWQKAEACHNAYQMLEIAVLQTLAVYKQGRRDDALKAMKRAVALAERGGCIRPFLELGTSVADLLNELQNEGVAVRFINRLLDRLMKDEFGMAPDVQDYPSIDAVSEESDLWIAEPLTQRELKVLSLLAQGLSNKEIAEKLFLSPETIKKHLYNTYQKLNVHSRTEALAKARELGILSLG
jgi:LuxR family maltose regulon positive regulatory protein